MDVSPLEKRDICLVSLQQRVAACCSTLQYVAVCRDSSRGHYGVATVSRIDKIIGLFCRISSL